MDEVKRLNYSEIMKTLEDQMSVYAAYHQEWLGQMISDQGALQEVFFALGYRPDLKKAVEKNAQLRRAQSADSSTTLPRTSS